MDIRNATIHDLPAIVAIYNSTIPSRMVTADTSPVTVESRLTWFHDHQPGKRPIWVVEINNTIIGWLSFTDFLNRRPAYDATAEVSIYIDEHFRGQGIGKTLLSKAIKDSPAIGVTTLLGYVFAHNQPSLKLFERFHFEPWGYFPRVALLDGEEKDLLILGLRVSCKTRGEGNPESRIQNPEE